MVLASVRLSSGQSSDCELDNRADQRDDSYHHRCPDGDSAVHQRPCRQIDGKCQCHPPAVESPVGKAHQPALEPSHGVAYEPCQKQRQDEQREHPRADRCESFEESGSGVRIDDRDGYRENHRDSDVD